MPENCDPPYPADQKVAILRRHLVDRIPIADLCEEYKIDSTLFYKWQTQLFENGSSVFARNTKKTRSQHQKTIEQLQAKLKRKNEAAYELIKAHRQLKKNLGNPDRHMDSPPSSAQPKSPNGNA